MKKVFIYEALVTCSALLMACGQTVYEPEDYDDVAAAVSALTSSEVVEVGGSIKATLKLAMGDIPFGISMQAHGQYQGVHGNWTYDCDLTCRDQTGTEQQTCNAETDSAVASLSIKGTSNFPNHKANIERSGEWSVTNIQSDVAVFAGHGSFVQESEFTAPIHPISRSVSMNTQADYDDIQIDLESGRPVAGTISFLVAAQAQKTVGSNTSNKTLNMSAKVTFNNGSKAQLEIDGTYHYEINLSDGSCIRIDKSIKI